MTCKWALFLLATNMPELGLYHIDPFGNIKEPGKKSYFVLGTGHEKVEGLLESATNGDSYETQNIDLERALILCRRALKRGTETDIFSGGPMDLVVVRKDRVNQYGRRIKKEIESFETRVFKEILAEEIGAEKKDD